MPIVACAALFLTAAVAASAAEGALKPVALRAEYLTAPLGVDTPQPRLDWRVESDKRAQVQTAYQILVSSSEEALAKDSGDLWDSGKIASSETSQIAYGGQPLHSNQRVWWKLRAWDGADQPSEWSASATWGMGHLQPEDWKAQWISFHDATPLHTKRDSLYLPPAHHYRKDFTVNKPIRQATLYVSALGLAEPQLNGQQLSDAFFESGWADYHKRSYYRVHDVTKVLAQGANRLGTIVTDGWYAGYVGYALLVGYGPNHVGRYLYGKTPALLEQLEIDYADGSHETVSTDDSWHVAESGAIREADLIMGESYDARQYDPNWSRPAGPSASSGALQPWNWEPAVKAESNGSVKAKFYEPGVEREVELGFQKPAKLQWYPAPPIRVTQELSAQRLTEPEPGVYIFDFGQNFAGVIRLSIKGVAGTKLTLRYGEMLHPDGHLMTENLRKARATDSYTLRGDDAGETWTPRFTYHGFQYVEIRGLPAKPDLSVVTGLVLHNDTPQTSDFSCSDEIMTRFWKNTQWTQRANFVEVPTDCPQRDERLGWMGDAQAYVRTATYNADVAAFFTKWLDDVDEAQRDSGAYPDYCPYPMAHGSPGATWGTAWTDAGIICPYTIWRVYDDRRELERHWDSMTRFISWRKQRAPDFRGRADGNTWGDWLNVGEDTPITFIDACYFAHSAQLMGEMAEGLGKKVEAEDYRKLFANIRDQFRNDYVKEDGSLSVDTQTAYVLTLSFGLARAADENTKLAQRLADKIAAHGFHMATGFLGTKPLLPALSENGQHDLACRLYQSRQFPSWGYEVVNGATSVWERWDSFTREHGFNGATGHNNAAMNSFSHYAFGAVNEWAFRDLAGIDVEGTGCRTFIIHPRMPTVGSNPDLPSISWVNARYNSPSGLVASRCGCHGGLFFLNVTIPANAQATVYLPVSTPPNVTEGERGKPLAKIPEISLRGAGQGEIQLLVPSGSYQFISQLPTP